uniref:Uncharacterized protein n=1 Tax=Cannabis sativa TaxID=3483 RepID=A0A803QIX3_CANSA
MGIGKEMAKDLTNRPTSVQPQHQMDPLRKLTDNRLDKRSITKIDNCDLEVEGGLNDIKKRKNLDSDRDIEREWERRLFDQGKKIQVLDQVHGKVGSFVQGLAMGESQQSMVGTGLRKKILIKPKARGSSRAQVGMG